MPLQLPPHPRSITTERLLLRPYIGPDVDWLVQDIRDNREHLAPWVWWAEDKHLPVAETARASAEHYLRNYDSQTSWIYGVHVRGRVRQQMRDGVVYESSLVGGCDLHWYSEGFGIRYCTLAYWLAQSAEGYGYITEAAKALMNLAASHETEVRILHDPKNTKSAAIPKRLGFEYHGVDVSGLSVWSREAP